MFLHQNKNSKPITLEKAFISPDFKIHTEIENMGFSENDILDNMIEKFIKYDKTSTMLILGVPGIGKSSIVSWIANKYNENDKLIILRFRDWEKEELEKGIMKAICFTLRCKKLDLDDKILVLDGFDEIKAVNISKSLLKTFFNDILDFCNLKIIFTSRPGYTDTYYFQNLIELLPFDIGKMGQFYQIIEGIELDENKIDHNNLDVLGIPVILYMSIMAGIDITKNTTKPELYKRIFSEKGGIFDKFSYDGIGYDKGSHPLRDIDNIKKYLKFLQNIAFSMFEKIL